MSRLPYSRPPSSVAADLTRFRPGLTGVAPESGPGVLGIGKDGDGVEGISDSGVGTSGYSKTGPGMWASSEAGDGIHAETSNPLGSAVAGYLKQGTGFPHGPSGSAIYGEAAAGLAGHFAGAVRITKDLHVFGNVSANDVILTGGNDGAEEFLIDEVADVEAGTVMVLGENGSLKMSRVEYDRRVAGVVSGAGSYRPAIILGRQGPEARSRPIALFGRVFCLADAAPSPIEIGDLLTSSSTPGHAMRALDPARSFGAVIGKALGTLRQGCGLVPVLVGLL
jgi:hypothetical protein